MEKIKTFYRRNLPHIQPIGATFFVTFRLKDSIPVPVLYRIRKEFKSQIDFLKKSGDPYWRVEAEYVRKRFFYKFDRWLDSTDTGPHYLQDSRIAELLGQQMKKFDGTLYRLIAYCIMSNHVHMLIETSIQLPENFQEAGLEEFEYVQLDQIMKRIKGPAAVEANRLLGRNGKFWQRESYDHYVRNEREFDRIVAYILNNPVKAGLVGDWAEWPFSYLAL